MSKKTSDFLDVMNREFTNREDFVQYIDSSYRHGDIKGGFNIIGAVNNLTGGKESFEEKLAQNFNIIKSSGGLNLLHTTVEDEAVYSYVFLDDYTPVFLTNANKTDQIPPTIWRFLQETNGLGRLMLSRREIDETRKRIISEHENVMIPYFSARRTSDSPIGSRKRPGKRRSIQYRADDGLEAYREMRYNYGVLPSIMTFELPNRFKFKIKDDGTFVHVRGGIQTLWSCLQREFDRVRNMMEYANTGSYSKADSSFFGEDKFSISTPWAVEVNGGLSAEQVETFPSQLNESFWEFSVSEFMSYPSHKSFEAEVIDETTHERTTMKSKGKDVRIYPREFTDIDQSLRIYNFLSDHFDSDCTPKRVA